jgi:L-arabonate dehydrase
LWFRSRAGSFQSGGACDNSGMARRTLRSQTWFRGADYYNFARRTYMRSEGLSSDALDGKPIIGICNSWSELNNCNMGLRDVAEWVKRGVIAAGGVPLEFPTISLGETFMRPTTMLFRNLMAMDVEESIRANPLDGVVLLCGCDKTTPAQLMGAASANIPAIMVPGGPMFAGNWRGKRIASGTDGRKLFDLYRGGKLSEEELDEIEGCVSRTVGHCTVMGTASTMTNVAEAMGMTLPGCAAIPAPDARRKAIAELSGRRIVEMVEEDLRPSRIMTREAFENAVTTVMALGGSTNAVVHLVAMAGRLGVSLTLDDFDRISRTTPHLANIKPSGEYLMEDFFHSGGLPALLRNILPLLHRDCLTVNGKTLGANVENAQSWNEDVIRPVERALSVGRRACHPPRQPLPRRRGYQAVGGISGVIAAPGESLCVREPRGDGGAGRSGLSTNRPKHRSRDEERRAQGGARFPGVGLDSDASDVAAAGDQRCGAHF